MASSDFQIAASVRSVLARHWIDLRRIQFGSFRGTVRLTGEVCRLGGELHGRHEPKLVDHVEGEIRALRGVERVYLDLTNWRRTPTGEWVCTDPPPSESSAPSELEAGPEVIAPLELEKTETPVHSPLRPGSP